MFLACITSVIYISSSMYKTRRSQREIILVKSYFIWSFGAHDSNAKFHMIFLKNFFQPESDINKKR